MKQLRAWAHPEPCVSCTFNAFSRHISDRAPIPVLFQTAEIERPPSPLFLPRWYVADLPVFCRIEHEVAKRLPLPVKFRLGSVEYVDWLEGK